MRSLYSFLRVSTPMLILFCLAPSCHTTEAVNAEAARVREEVRVAISYEPLGPQAAGTGQEVFFTPMAGCNYETCSFKLAGQLKSLREKALRSRQPESICLPCCEEGQPVMATVVAVPRDPDLRKFRKRVL